jgi:exosortase family protein XrtF
MDNFSFKEFRPTIFFLIKFLGVYLVGNLLYGFYVNYYTPQPDPITHFVTVHSARVIEIFGYPVSVVDQINKPYTLIIFKGRSILSVYEGCNGVNSMIVFVAFIVAFGPINKAMSWFVCIGLLIIHVCNIGRIFFLFYVSEYLPAYMYFIHKYLFTAVLYVIIFIMWFLWVKKNSAKGHER